MGIRGQHWLHGIARTILENSMKIARRLTISAALAIGGIAGLPLIAAANGVWVS